MMNGGRRGELFRGINTEQMVEAGGHSFLRNEGGTTNSFMAAMAAGGHGRGGLEGWGKEGADFSILLS